MYAQESLALDEAMGNKVIMTNCLVNLGWTALQARDIEKALRYTSDGLELFREQGYKQGMIWALEVAAISTELQSQPERAAKLLAATTGLREVWGILPLPIENEFDNRLLSKIKIFLARASFQAAWNMGKAMTQEETIAFALEMRTTE